MKNHTFLQNCSDGTKIMNFAGATLILDPKRGIYVLDDLAGLQRMEPVPTCQVCGEGGYHLWGQNDICPNCESRRPQESQALKTALYAIAQAGRPVSVPGGFEPFLEKEKEAAPMHQRVEE